MPRTTATNNSAALANAEGGSMITYQIAMSAGRDAANRRARKAWRTTWNLADWKHAARIVRQLMGVQQ